VVGVINLHRGRATPSGLVMPGYTTRVPASAGPSHPTAGRCRLPCTEKSGRRSQGPSLASVQAPATRNLSAVHDVWFSPAVIASTATLEPTLVSRLRSSP
jgi:hypothetical protein